MGVFQNVGDLRRGFRQHDHQGHLPVGGEAVGLEGPHLDGLGDHPFAGHNGAERCGNRVALGQDGGIGNGHGQHGDQK